MTDTAASGAATVVSSDAATVVSRHIRAGDYLHFAATPSRANALLSEVCRQYAGSRSLTIGTTAIHSSAHYIAMTGCAEKVIAGFLGDTIPTPRPHPLYADLWATGDPFEFEPQSLLSYCQRLQAGAMGLDWAVTASLTGSSLAEQGHVANVVDPADDTKTITLVTSLRPDITVAHGVIADTDGNVVALPPVGEGWAAVYAARRGVIASVERIVTPEELHTYADHVVVPAARVLAVVELPFGAHPQQLRADGIEGVRSYVDDYRFIEDLACAAGDPAGVQDWLDTWLWSAGVHQDYLDLLGPDRLEGLTDISIPESDVVRTARPVGFGDSFDVTEREQLVVMGARAIVRLVEQHDFTTVLAGIGASHVAAWLASRLLAMRGRKVSVVAELGACDFDPVDGDVFLFSLRHTMRASARVGVPEILGGMVAANAKCLGVLGAGEIGECGDINTSVSSRGRWLTGSGGANDIASSAACLVIAEASPRRYVSEVAYRTSPGRNVWNVVSQFGEFTRSADGPFHLASYLPDAQADQIDPVRGQTIGDAARKRLAECTSWDVGVATDLIELTPPTEQELGVLRDLDPTSIYA